MWTGIRCKRSDRTSTYTGKRDDGSLRTSYGRRSLFQGCVTKMSETPGVVETPSPLLGEHNREIFGLTEEEEAQLKEEGVI